MILMDKINENVQDTSQVIKTFVEPVKYSLTAKNVRYKISVMPEEKKYADIILAIDCSESMHAVDPGQKIRKEAILKFLENLGFDENKLNVSFIFWSSKENTKCSTWVNNLKDATTLFEKTMPGDNTPSTDFDNVLTTAIEKLDTGAESTDRRITRSILIITDGQRDCGGINGYNLNKDGPTNDAKSKGYTILILGMRVPPSAKNDLLEIERSKAGNCYFIEELPNLSSKLIDLNKTIMSDRTVAVDAEFIYILPRHMVLKDPLPANITYVKENDNTTTIVWKVGEIKSGNRFQNEFLVEFHPKNASICATFTQRKCMLKYKDPYDGKYREDLIEPKTVKDINKPPFWSPSRWAQIVTSYRAT